MAAEDCTQKRCTKCGQVKQVDQFYKSKRLSSGYSSECKECTKKRVSDWVKNNKEKKTRYFAEYHVKNADKKRHAAKEWRENNLDRHIANVDKWRSENSEKVAEIKTNWRRKNIGKARLSARLCMHKRRALISGSGGEYTKLQISLLLEKQKFKCVCCQKTIKEEFHVDHIQPISKRGSNGMENIQLLCPSCNRKKSAKDPIKFMQEQGFLL